MSVVCMARAVSSACQCAGSTASGPHQQETLLAHRLLLLHREVDTKFYIV